MMDKVMIVGGSGFLGRHLTKELISKYKVYNFDRTSNLSIPEDQNFIGSVFDYPLLEKSMKGMRFVFHFAAIADIGEASLSPKNSIETNILGTVNVIESCIKNDVERLVFSSTIYVHSDLGSFYRVSKQCSELIIDSYCDADKLNATIIRFGSLYGTDANEFNSIANMVNSAITDGKIIRNGTGEEEREYINIADASRICRVLIENTDEIDRCQYVMATGYQKFKIKEITKLINSMLGGNIDVEFTGHKNNEHYDITPYRFQPKVAVKPILEWTTDIGQGLFECIEEAYKKVHED